MKNNISIIIATYNSEKTIGATLESLRSQKLSVPVYIVDGGSTDRTIEILNDYRDVITEYSSERDEGVYDAWNKGLQFVSSSWVVFLGSDDWLMSDNEMMILNEEILRVEDDNSTVFLAGEVRRVCDGVVTSIENKFIEKNRSVGFHNAMPFTHTGTAQRVSLFENFGLFDSGYKIAGDFDFFARVMSGGNYRVAICPEYVLCMGDGGMSNSLRWRKTLLREKRKVLNKFGRLPLISLIYIDLKLIFYSIVGWFKN